MTLSYIKLPEQFFLKKENTGYFAKFPSKLKIFWRLSAITDLLKLGCLNAQAKVAINQRIFEATREM